MMRDRSARAHTDTNINTAPQCGRQTLISGSDAVRATGSDSAGARAVVGRTVRFDDTEVPHAPPPLTRAWRSSDFDDVAAVPCARRDQGVAVSNQ